MKTITKYRSEDGSEFSTKDKAIERDKLIVDVKSIMAKLKPVPPECNWDGYVQQEPSVIQEVKERLFEIADREGILKWWIDDQFSKHGKTHSDLITQCHASWFSRMLDGGNAPLSNAYDRLCLIDENLREWNQPYFALNPDKGEQICRG